MAHRTSTSPPAFPHELRRVRLATQLAIARSGTETPPEVVAQLREELAALDLRLAELHRDAGQPAALLATAVSLAADELAFLWAVVARATDPLLLAHLQVLCGTDARKGLSLAHYATIMGLDEERAGALANVIAPSHPLLRYRFLFAPEAQQIDACTPLTVPHRLCAFLRGDTDPDELVHAAGGHVHAPYAAQLDDAQQRSLQRIQLELSGLESVVVIVEGPTGTGRRTAVALAAQQFGRSVCSIDLRRIAPSYDALEGALTALMRECLLTDAIPVIAEVDEISGGTADPAAREHLLARIIESAPCPVALTTNVAGIDVKVRGRRIVRAPWSVPETAARRALWETALGDDAPALGGHIDQLALRYRMGAGGIHGGAASARAIRDARGAGAALEPHDLQEGIRNNIAEHMGELAQRTEVKQRWDDLVLPPETHEDVQNLIARVRHAHLVYERWGFKQKMARGIGVAALFSGPPGTGKTMVAALLARELDLELYQVDLSKVVSKWVGETEKHLARIFEAADAGHALLLFDEADSLFAKRTEVKSAVDRYANLEVNYLLQRIESFGGVTILTTNLDSSIDPALRRRLAAHITFQAPEQAESMKLWERMLATGAPIKQPIAYDRLAKTFSAMVGANIRNAVLAAAFMAAADGVPISQAHLERAARGEYRAMGRSL